MWVARSIEGVQAAQDRWGIRLIIEINTATLLAKGRSGRGVAAVVEGGVESWEGGRGRKEGGTSGGDEGVGAGDAIPRRGD